MSADTPDPTPATDGSPDRATEAPLPRALPRPGDRVGDLVVRASGALPFSGWPFVVYRHTGRTQLASIRSAQAEAAKNKADPTPIDSVLHLLPHVARVDQGDGLQAMKLDDILDLDGDDVDALFDAVSPAPSGARGAASDGEPHPPSPSS